MGCAAAKPEIDQLAETMHLKDVMMLREEKYLRVIAQPLIRKKLDMEAQIQLNDTESRALVSQYCKVKRKIAKIVAKTKNQWVLFNSSSVYLEEELKLLYNFYYLICRYIPKSYPLWKSIDYNGYKTLQSINTNNLTFELASDLTADNTAQVANIYLEINQSNEYELPAGPINLTIVSQMMHIFRGQKRISKDSIQRLLRQTYHILCKLPNITKMKIGPHDKVTIVGDLHGQLLDLIHILEESGLPSMHHKYIFNGDFVDRGQQGVEIMCLLMGLLIVCPQSVAFNRGNHEDFAVCTMYGFKDEVLAKYDEVTFGMFIEIFSFIPLYCMINRTIFILHGGLFHAGDITLEELDKINRYENSLLDEKELQEISDETVRKEDNELEYYKQIQRDTLWSDPKESDGLGKSNRGAGVAFGPDVTKCFLQKNRLSFIVRSHECIRSGFDLPFINSPDPSHHHLLCTLFSASNYSNHSNTAAYMELMFSDHIEQIKYPGRDVMQKIPNTDYSYIVHYYNTSVNMSEVFEDMNYNYPPVVIPQSPHVSVAGKEKKAAFTFSGDVDDDAKTVIDYDHLPSKDDLKLLPEVKDMMKIEDVDLTIGTDISSNSTVGNSNSQMVPSATTEKPLGSNILPFPTSFSIHSTLSLAHLIYKQRVILYDAFLTADIATTGVISIDTWLSLLSHICKIQISWVSVLSKLIEDLQKIKCEFQLAGIGDLGKDWNIYKVEEGVQRIEYITFLNLFEKDTLKAYMKTSDVENDIITANHESSNHQYEIVTALYTNHFKTFEALFDCLTSKHEPMITHEAFLQGMQQLNSYFQREKITCPQHETLSKLAVKNVGDAASESSSILHISDTDINKIFDLLDVTQSDAIDLNIFLEFGRILDLKYSFFDEMITYWDELQVIPSN